MKMSLIQSGPVCFWQRYLQHTCASNETKPLWQFHTSHAGSLYRRMVPISPGPVLRSGHQCLSVPGCKPWRLLPRHGSKTPVSPAQKPLRCRDFAYGIQFVTWSPPFFQSRTLRVFRLRQTTDLRNQDQSSWSCTDRADHHIREEPRKQDVGHAFGYRRLRDSWHA